MKSDLEELIEAYEAEQAELEREIAGYVAEADYKYAHYHQKVLWKLKQKIVILKVLQNPVYRFISDEERRIENCKMASNKQEFVNSIGFFNDQISISEDKIRELQKTPLVPVYDGQDIDDALFGLVNKECNGFKLFFKSEPDLFIRFKLRGEFIEIELSPAENTGYADLFSRNSTKLGALGFRLNDGLWVIQYALAHFKDALEIKTILAKLIYEVFYTSGGNDHAKIVYD
jgi:hypothetical protein